MRLNLINAPNQEVPFYAEDHFIILKLRTFRGVLFASVVVDGDIVVAGHRVVVDEDIFEFYHLQRKYGHLSFKSKYNTPITDYEQYNSAVYLQYDIPN